MNVQVYLLVSTCHRHDRRLLLLEHAGIINCREWFRTRDLVLFVREEKIVSERDLINFETPVWLSAAREKVLVVWIVFRLQSHANVFEWTSIGAKKLAADGGVFIEIEADAPTASFVQNNLVRATFVALNASGRDWKFQLQGRRNFRFNRICAGGQPE